jgi:phosphatidylglycerophosphatase A
MFEKYSAQSPTRKTLMTLHFAFSSLPHIISSFFGVGVLRPASGTWGSLAALLLYMAFEACIPWWAWAGVVLLSFVAGAWACGVTGHDIGVHDHSSMVIDEVYAVWMVLLTVPSAWEWQVAAFLTFRFFDIVKIQPTKWFDTAARWQNGWGVMLDDAAAAAQSILLLQIVRHIFC